MRNPSVSDLRFATAALFAGAMTLSGIARADDKQVCSDAYDKTQSMRRAGLLQQAKEQAVICSRESCARFVRVDCFKWAEEIDAAQPTVVIEARDGAGKDLTDVSVSIDGELWVTSLDGKARAIDPGKHRLRFVASGQAPVDETVVVREGEKGKRVAVTIGSAPPAALPTSPPPAEEDLDDASFAPWVLGGVGAASLVAGGILAVVVAGEKSTFDEHCDDATRTCDREGIDAGESGRTLGPISTVALLAGAGLVGVATVWIVAESTAGDDEEAASLGAGAEVSADRARVVLQGRF